MNLRDLPYDPSFVSKEAIDAGCKWLVDNRENFESNTNFVIVSSEGDATHQILGGPCHSYISSTPLKDRNLVATEIAYPRTSFNKEGVEAWLKWFLYESFASPFILNKDNYEFCRDYGILVPANLPTPFMQSILITSRRPIDRGNSTAFEVFKRIADAGLSKDICFILLFSSHLATNNLSLSSSLSCAHGDHKAFYLPRTEQAFINFLTWEWENRLDEHIKEGRTYDKDTSFNGVNSYLYPNGDIGNPSDWIFQKARAALAEYRKAGNSKDVPKVVNPFASSSATRTPPPSRIGMDEFEHVIMPLFTKEYAQYVRC